MKLKKLVCILGLSAASVFAVTGCSDKADDVTVVESDVTEDTQTDTEEAEDVTDEAEMEIEAEEPATDVAAETSFMGVLTEEDDGTVLLSEETGSDTDESVVLNMDPAGTVIIDGSNGETVSDLSELDFTAEVYAEAYYDGAMTRSIPPQINPDVLVVNLNDGVLYPTYATVLQAEETEDGFKVDTTDGSIFLVTSDTAVKRYDAEDALTGADLTADVTFLVWTDAEGNATDVLITGSAADTAVVEEAVPEDSAEATSEDASAETEETVETE